MLPTYAPPNHRHDGNNAKLFPSVFFMEDGIWVTPVKYVEYRDRQLSCVLSFFGDVVVGEVSSEIVFD